MKLMRRIKRAGARLAYQGEREDLNFLLGLARPHGTLEEKLLWIEKVVRWLRRPSAEKGEAYLHLEAFLAALEDDEHAYTEFAAIIGSVLSQSSALHLFTESGLHSESSFISETLERVLRVCLPQPPEFKNLTRLLERTLASPEALVWFEGIPPDLALQLIEMLTAPVNEVGWKKIHKELTDSLKLLSAEVAALAFSPQVRTRIPEFVVSTSPFLDLCNTCNKSTVDACLGQIGNVFQNLEESGVSIELVYRLERMSHVLKRIERILDVLKTLEKDPTVVLPFVTELCKGIQHDKSIGFVFSTSVHQLAKKVVERTGDTGEHYITSTRGEYFHMLKMALGGGFLTTFTTMLKFIIGWAKLPLLFDGIFTAVNYAGSFLFMQMLGFKLATKQPSMTASALAKKLEDHQKEFKHTAFVTLVARMLRTQTVAIAGNLGAVIPTAIAVNFIYHSLTGKHFLSADYAKYVLDAHNPFTSLSLFYATFTGFLLWLTSVASGWIENWIVHRRLPEAISYNRTLTLVIGRNNAQRLSRFFTGQISGIWSNVILGCLLAMTSGFGKFSGLPIDARHVTLSAGAVTFAACAVGTSHPFSVLASALGVVLIGIINLTVSFSLALFVAIRARNIDATGLSRFMKAVWLMLRTHPKQFFFPPKEDTPAH